MFIVNSIKDKEDVETFFKMTSRNKINIDSNSKKINYRRKSN